MKKSISIVISALLFLTISCTLTFTFFPTLFFSYPTEPIVVTVYKNTSAEIEFILYYRNISLAFDDPRRSRDYPYKPRILDNKTGTFPIQPPSNVTDNDRRRLVRVSIKDIFGNDIELRSDGEPVTLELNNGKSVKCYVSTTYLQINSFGLEFITDLFKKLLATKYISAVHMEDL